MFSLSLAPLRPSPPHAPSNFVFSRPPSIPPFIPISFIKEIKNKTNKHIHIMKIRTNKKTNKIKTKQNEIKSPQNKARNQTTSSNKNSELVSCGPSTLAMAMGLPWSAINIPSNTPLGKTKFSPGSRY